MLLDNTWETKKKKKYYGKHLLWTKKDRIKTLETRLVKEQKSTEWQQPGNIWECERMYFAAEEIKTEANNLLKANYLHPINQDPKTVPSCRHVEDLQTRLINLNKKMSNQQPQMGCEVPTTKATQSDPITSRHGKGTRNKEQEQIN